MAKRKTNKTLQGGGEDHPTVPGYCTSPLLRKSHISQEGVTMGHGLRCVIPHFCIFVTYTQCVSPNLEPESAIDASC